MLLIDALNQARQRLSGVTDLPSLDAQVLLAHILGRPRAWILAHPEVPLSSPQHQALERYLLRLEQGEPLPYLLGRWEFYGLEFNLTPNVLIPRPETELLVDQALRWLRSQPGRRLAADVGTGSGCIAVSLAVNVPDLRLAVSDISQAALRVARSNAARHQVSARIDFIQADLLSPFSRSPTPPFHLICANLPYIPASTLEDLQVARREPRLALHGGADGLDLIRALLQQAPGRLAPGGLMLLEIEASQGDAARALAQTAFPQAQVQVLPDLAGRDRLVRVERGGV